ncbi:hypothetical protein MRB53_023433 [Persea americana]|uniref:Uncharacterized protein n=1 Tax=Persea americana TaxID=3435 RepID=A0ACC2LA23_PERAE|nr:hypothetical protein MRB53_023433 [Persea americana]
MKYPLMVRETRQGLERAQNLAFSSTYSREGRFPANFPMASKEKDSLLEESMDWGMVRAGLPFFQMVGGSLEYGMRVLGLQIGWIEWGKQRVREADLLEANLLQANLLASWEEVENARMGWVLKEEAWRPKA